MWANYEYAWGGKYDSYYKPQKLNDCVIIADELQPIRFQGQFFDPETSLHYNRFRYYDSDVGMFIQRDPIGLLGGDNVFQYADSSIMWIDPFGLCANAIPDCRINMYRGIAFNRNRATGFDYNELYILKPNADKLSGNNKYVRLDSYNPSTGDIVLRKHTQLADIDKKTAKGYLNELSRKYPPNATIANVQSSGKLGRETLQGLQILEVPIQNKPIPQGILDHASSLNIDIRQVSTKKPN